MVYTLNMEMENNCVQLRLNLAKNNICPFPFLNNSDINKIQICFSLTYKSSGI